MQYPYVVVFDTDTNRWDVDTRITMDVLPGCVYDPVSQYWSFAPQGSAELRLSGAKLTELTRIFRYVHPLPAEVGSAKGGLCDYCWDTGVERGDHSMCEPCAACNAEAGEPCRPDCLSSVTDDEGQPFADEGSVA